VVFNQELIDIWPAKPGAFALATYMRVSVPGIPQAILNAKPSLSIQCLAEATEILADFIKSGNITVLTGAGVSVDSGIRAYRGEDGRYMNPNYKYIKSHYSVYKYYTG
jgi:NAD+-dependent protein deacetylase sirtuin 4